MTLESVSKAGCANGTLRDYVRWYDGALTPPFCAKLLEAFQQASAQHVRRNTGWRAGLDDSAWTELDITPLGDDALQAHFFRKIEDYLARYNAELKLSIPVPLSGRLAEFRMKHYKRGKDEKFQLHFDSINEVADRYMVFLWYLNDVIEGGETEFPDLGIKVAARVGRLLMFPPYWMYQHSGLPPQSGDKYILSTYMLFPRN